MTPAQNVQSAQEEQEYHRGATAIADAYRLTLAGAIFDSFSHTLDRFLEPLAFRPAQGERITPDGAVELTASGKTAYRYQARLAGEEVNLYTAHAKADVALREMLKAAAAEPQFDGEITAYQLGCDETGNRTFLVLDARLDDGE